MSVLLPEGFQGDLQTKEMVFRQGEPIREWSALPDADPSQPARCSWHYGYSAITSGGSVAPCCGLTKEEYDFGRVEPGRTTFADVWNNPLYRTSRAAFAGARAEDAAHTVCTKCPLSPFMYHLYSLHDFKVIAQFGRVMKGSDPRLDEAFDLLSRARYDVPSTELDVPGAFRPPAQMFEGQHPERTAAFVAFFERELLNENVTPPGR